MRNVIFICTAVFALTMVSCVKNSSEYKALQAQKDSLALANTQNAAELEQILGLLNEVEDNFNSIKAAENYLSVQSNASGELTPSTKERIQSDMKFITEVLDKNKQRIADLEKRLKKSSLQSSQLSATLKKLQTELEEKTAALLALSDELAKKDQQIAELHTHVTNLSSDVQALKTQADAQKETITQQQTELNTVYYCFGTSKELKDNKIVVKNQLGTDFDRSYFIKEKDYNQLHVIPLYDSKRGKLISRHPDGSYEFGKDLRGQLELRILNPNSFWSLTKYLVIQVSV
jgi:chromosome segregation ATPase